MARIEEIIREEIEKGKAVSNATLQELTNSTRREVSAAVHSLRGQGMIICSDTQGYYIPNDDAELIRGYDTLWKKAVNNLAVLKPMRKEIKKRGLLQETAEVNARKKRKDGQKEIKEAGLSD